MSVTVYDGETKIHPAGFIGVVVTRGVSKDNLREYFSFRDADSITGFVTAKQKRELIGIAKELDAEWGKLQAEGKLEYKRTLRPSLRNSSCTIEIPIQGLSAVSYVRWSHGRPCIHFSLCISILINGKAKTITRTIKDSHSQAKEALADLKNRLTELRGYKEIPAAWKKVSISKRAYEAEKARIQDEVLRASGIGEKRYRKLMRDLKKERTKQKHNL